MTYLCIYENICKKYSKSLITQSNLNLFLCFWVSFKGIWTGLSLNWFKVDKNLRPDWLRLVFPSPVRFFPKRKFLKTRLIPVLSKKAKKLDWTGPWNTNLNTSLNTPLHVIKPLLSLVLYCRQQMAKHPTHIEMYQLRIFVQNMVSQIFFLALSQFIVQ